MLPDDRTVLSDNTVLSDSCVASSSSLLSLIVILLDVCGGRCCRIG